MNKERNIVIAQHDEDGMAIAANTPHGFIVTDKTASSHEEAKEIVKSMGYTLVDWETDTHAPSEYFEKEFGECLDPFSVSTY